LLPISISIFSSLSVVIQNHCSGKSSFSSVFRIIAIYSPAELRVFEVFWERGTIGIPFFSRNMKFLSDELFLGFAHHPLLMESVWEVRSAFVVVVNNLD
jgi:hypothetical protein